MVIEGALLGLTGVAPPEEEDHIQIHIQIQMPIQGNLIGHGKHQLPMIIGIGRMQMQIQGPLTSRGKMIVSTGNIPMQMQI